MLNDNYTAFCVNRDLLQCWRGRQNPSSLYQGIAQVLLPLDTGLKHLSYMAMDRKTRHPRVWGLTGGIGSGKSFAASILKGLGVPVMEMDRLARNIMAPGTPVAGAVAREFGPEILRPDNSIDRAALARIVFGDHERLKALEKIIHPPTLAATFELVDSPPLDRCRLVFVESAIIFDAGIDSLLARTVLVTAPVETRIRRVMSRDGVSEKDVRIRMAAQIDENIRLTRADAVLHNSGDRHALRRQIVNMLIEVESKLIDRQGN